MEEVTLRRWHLIDDDGSREVLIDPRDGTIISGVKVKHQRGEWPPFTQFAVRASTAEVTGALRDVADEFGRACRRLDGGGPAREHGVVIAEHGDLVVLTEPGIEFDNRFVTAASSEALVDRLGADGVHFGFDPAADTLHLTRYSRGFPEFTWCDSLRPGPSFALEFHADGTCTEQDPRKFALEKLDLPESASSLDRRAFVSSELGRLGLTEVDPEFEDVDAHAIFEIGAAPHRAGIQ